MTYLEAIQALGEGKKVRLPEWRGYWFMGKDVVMALTKNGDVEVAWAASKTRDLEERTDWEIANGLDFGWAITALKAGKRVCRKGWNGKGLFIFLVNGSTFKVNRPPLLGIYEEGTEINYHAHIDIKSIDGTIVPWVGSQTDVLAEDWELAE